MNAGVPPLLFYGSDVYTNLERRKASLRDEIAALDRPQILNSTVDRLAVEIVAKYALNVPVLIEDQKYAERQETRIDVSRDQSRLIFDRGQPSYVDAMRITIWVPFEGDPELFRIQPSTFTMNPPRGEVSGQKVGFVFVDTNLTPERVNAEFSNWLRDVKQYLGWHQQGSNNFNSTLVGFASQEVNARQQKLRNTEDVLAGLNIPLKQTTTSEPIQRPSATSPTRRGGAGAVAHARDQKPYDCFASYAGEDRRLVQELVVTLTELGLKVWWDRGQIRLGDRLSQKIDQGLSSSRYGLVIISDSFIAKQWPEAELRALATRAISSGRRVILPVLVGIDHDRFAAQYPLLADIVSTTYKNDLKTLAEEIIAAID